MSYSNYSSPIGGEQSSNQSRSGRRSFNPMQKPAPFAQDDGSFNRFDRGNQVGASTAPKYPSHGHVAAGGPVKHGRRKQQGGDKSPFSFGDDGSDRFGDQKENAVEQHWRRQQQGQRQQGQQQQGQRQRAQDGNAAFSESARERRKSQFSSDIFNQSSHPKARPKSKSSRYQQQTSSNIFDPAPPQAQSQFQPPASVARQRTHRMASSDIFNASLGAQPSDVYAEQPQTSGRRRMTGQPSSNIFNNPDSPSIPFQQANGPQY